MADPSKQTRLPPAGSGQAAHGDEPESRIRNPESLTIAWLPGDGIGREVTEAALGVLRAIAPDLDVNVTEHPVGGAGYDAAGDPLPEATLDACLKADAVFLGAVGGPKWDDVPYERRPEAGLLKLRKALGAFANLRPVAVPEALAEGSPLRPERARGTDLLVVRELTGGLYFGEPRLLAGAAPGRIARNTMGYEEHEIARVAHVAFQWAERRGGRVTSVDKANVLEVSRLWRAVVTEIGRGEYPHVALDHLYVDNAAMQLVLDPQRFDVILTENLFGDILSDLAATLPGSLGLLPSASIGGDVGLFEPVHGSAPDLAGRDVANPTAAILSLALLLDHAGHPAEAAALRRGVETAFADGLRTADLGGTTGMRAFADAVAERAAGPVPVP